MKTPSKFGNLVIGFVLLVMLAAALAPHQAAAGNVGPVVDLVLLPSTQNISAGSTFDITIQAQCNGQDVLGVDAFINFDPTYLEVQNITQGTTLNILLQNTFDNTAGTVNYSAGTMTAPFPSTTFTVATIKYKAKNVNTSTTTSITLNTPAGTNAPRKTQVIWEASSVLRNAGQLSLNIQGSGGTTNTAPAQGGGSPAGAAPAAPPAISSAVSSAVPFNSAADVPASSNIDIVFNQAMNTASVQSAFSISPAIKGSFSWAGNVMTFKPESGLSPGQSYIVTIGTSAQNAAGSRLANEYKLSFTTLSQTQNIPPPASNPANIPTKPAASPGQPAASPSATATPPVPPSPSPAPSQKYFDPQPGLYFNSEAELKAYQAARSQTAALPPPANAQGVNWWLIAGGIAGVAVVLVILYLVFNGWIRRD